MRVLHVTRDFPPRRNGGISTAVGGLVRASREAGVRCAVLSFDAWRPKRTPRPTLPDTADVVRLGGPADLPKADALAARFRPDVVHVHHGMLWDLACKLPAAQRVFTVHVVQSVLRTLRGLEAPTQSERAQARAIAEADAVVVPSEATRREIEALSRRRDVRVAPLGIEMPPSPAPAPPAFATILYVGRFADVKGTAELFASIDAVVARVPEARFVVAGGLPDSPKAERRWRERLSATASERARRRTSLVGWLGPVALESAYAEASLFLAPSWHETFGLAAAEAMARGLPVVATDVGALPERVRDGETGRLVPPRDSRALGEAIAGLLGDPRRLERMRAAARAAARESAWPRVLPAHLDAYAAAATEPSRDFGALPG